MTPSCSLLVQDWERTQHREIFVWRLFLPAIRKGNLLVGEKSLEEWNRTKKYRKHLITLASEIMVRIVIDNVHVVSLWDKPVIINLLEIEPFIRNVNLPIHYVFCLPGSQVLKRYIAAFCRYNFPFFPEDGIQ